MHKLIHDSALIGIDEAGRGPLAGPVVVAAVWLPSDFDVDGIADSKVLKELQRDLQAERIRKHAKYAIVQMESQEIDRIGILNATLKAMSTAYFNLEIEKRAIVDGNILPGELRDCASTEVKGDGKFACIAAASILAKTTRDRIMKQHAKEFPGYGFERHFGYSTPEHLALLRELGPCSLHRMSFAPVAEAALQLSLFP